MDNATSLQVHGVQDHQLLVCEAVGSDPAWYQGRATGQNALPRATPPGTWAVPPPRAGGDPRACSQRHPSLWLACRGKQGILQVTFTCVNRPV